MRDPKGEARLIVESVAAAGRAATDVFTGATPPEVERLRARVKVLTAEGGALDHTVWTLEDEREETLRRVRVALGDLGVADCDDPLTALEALAADVPRRESEATDEHNAAVLRAHAEGRIAGLREALDACVSARDDLRTTSEMVDPGSRVMADDASKFAAGANLCAEAVEALLAKGGGA